MSDDVGSTPPNTAEPALVGARSRLDYALLGFNRHALLAERYRRSVERFRASQRAFAEGTAERVALREARTSAAQHRMVVRAAVGEFVRLLRDQGVAPELALVAVKTRLFLSVTVANPGAPSADASMLAADASLWAIEAYFEAA